MMKKELCTFFMRVLKTPIRRHCAGLFESFLLGHETVSFLHDVKYYCKVLFPIYATYASKCKILNFVINWY